MIRANLRRVEDSIASINNELTRMEIEISALEFALRSVVTVWQGEAREAFVDAIVKWNSDMQKLHEMATEATHYAQVSISEMQISEKKRSGAWKR